MPSGMVAQDVRQGVFARTQSCRMSNLCNNRQQPELPTQFYKLHATCRKDAMTTCVAATQKTPPMRAVKHTGAMHEQTWFRIPKICDTITVPVAVPWLHCQQCWWVPVSAAGLRYRQCCFLWLQQQQPPFQQQLPAWLAYSPHSPAHCVAQPAEHAAHWQHEVVKAYWVGNNKSKFDQARSAGACSTWESLNMASIVVVYIQSQQVTGQATTMGMSFSRVSVNEAAHTCGYDLYIQSTSHRSAFMIGVSVYVNVQETAVYSSDWG